MMENPISTYTIHARFFPAIISSLPLFILWYYFSKEAEFKALSEYILSITFFKEFTISIVFLYFFSQVIRVTSKVFEDKYFIKEEGFPTTYLLMYSNDTLSDDYKSKIHERLKKDFDLNLLTKEEEKNNIKEARKRIAESTKLIILKIGDGVLVKKHNIWYGFFRNLIGGALFGLLFSLINLIVAMTFYNDFILIVSSIILLVMYLAIFCLRKFILIQNGEAYAKQLLSEYITF